MKWSLPRIEHRKMFSAVTSRLHLTLVGLFVGSIMTSGCASLPAMSPRTADALSGAPAQQPYTTEELARMAGMPAVPVFDSEEPKAAISDAVASEAIVPAVASATTASELAQASPPLSTTSSLAPNPTAPAATTSVASAESPVAMADVKSDTKMSDALDVPKPVDPAPSMAKAPESAIAQPIIAAVDAPKEETQKSEAAKPETKSPDVAKTSPEAQKSEPVAAPKVEVALGGGANKNSNARSDSGMAANKNSGQKNSSVPKPRVANSKPSGVLVKPPESFAWKKDGKSSGNRAFQKAHLGDEGYRTLVVGSVGGNDPLALELVDRLARHLHEDGLILGGFDCTVIRTINPDGEANRKFRNEKGDYVNSGFPKALSDVSKVQMPEVKFVLEQIDALKPQRIVHIRSVEGGKGVVATGFSSQTAAREASEWLKFKMLMLPERSNPGSLERYVSTSGVSDMITIGVPDTTPKDEVWSLYGDTILNLLLAEDFASREVARKQ